MAVVAAALVAGARSEPSPPTPTGLTTIALDGQVELAWQAVAGADSYTIYRGGSPTTLLPLQPGVTGTTYSDTTAPNGATEFYSVRAVAAGAESTDSPVVDATAQARACSSGNPVHLENCYPGSAGWKLVLAEPLSAGGIEGFATASSINKGGSIDLKVNGAAGATIRAEIYRTGYYGGAAGRAISTIRGIPGIAQPACADDGTTGLVDCSNWSVSATITTSAAWVSGVYMVRLVREDTGADAQVLFVVRDDGRASDLLYGVPMNTYEAYNNYGGRSLYEFNSTGGRASKVSFNRPFGAPRDSALHDWYPRADLPLVSWLEQSGYDVSYNADSDLETGGILGHKAYVLGVHSEYWSQNMRGALQTARDGTTNIFVAGANAVYWKVRFENGDRTLVCYKSNLDPSGPTTRWRDAAPGPNAPENALLGAMYVGDNDAQFFPLVVSQAEGQDRIWRSTPVASLAPGSTTSIGSGLVGWEWDKRAANGVEPPGVVTLASSPVAGGLAQVDGASLTGSTTVNVTKYTAPGGSLVFDTGTNFWSRGLALERRGSGPTDPDDPAGDRERVRGHGCDAADTGGGPRLWRAAPEPEAACADRPGRARQDRYDDLALVERRRRRRRLQRLPVRNAAHGRRPARHKTERLGACRHEPDR